MNRLSRRGFSMPELMIVMTITGILSGILIVFYSQSHFVLRRGMSKTELQQRARLASIRIIPKITSTVYRPEEVVVSASSGSGTVTATTVTPELNPIASPLSTDPASSDPFTNPGSNPGTDIVLNCTAAFVQEQMRETVVDFNPRAPLYDQLRLFFRVDSTDPELGTIGTLWMDRNTDGNTNDDILVASNLTSVLFRVLPGNVVRVRVEARGYIPNATSGRSVDTQIYETDVYLPVDTAAGG